jgi:LysM repeat protein
MDTISRESSPSYLPIAGLIAGLVGLLLGAIALANASKANKLAAAAATEEQVSALEGRVEGVESTASNANSAAERASSSVATLQRSTQDAFTAVAGEMGKINGEIAKLQEAAKAAPRGAAAGAAKSTTPAVAGPDEYVIAAGDTGAKIARARGISLPDLQAVNPGVDWTKLKVGQKIKLPAKR